MFVCDWYFFSVAISNFLLQTIQARARNAFGGAEVVDAAFSSGLKTRLAGHISLSAPLSPSLKTCGEVSLFGIEKDLSDFASCIEGIRGLRASIRVSRSAWTVFGTRTNNDAWPFYRVQRMQH